MVGSPDSGSRRGGRIARGLGYLWASPNTCLGLCLWPLTRLAGGRSAKVDGVLEMWGPPFAKLLAATTGLAGGAAAMTLGHVVIGTDERALRLTRVHERAHVAQYARWGPLFLPAYGVCSLLCIARRRHPYRDNPFERAAREVERDFALAQRDQGSRPNTSSSAAPKASSGRVS